MRTNKPTWVRYGPELLDLDAVLCLAGYLGVSQVEAGGFIALVVALGIANADDDGQIDHLTDKAIERACYWTGERGELVKAFCACGVFAGERDSDTQPLSIDPGLWRALAGKSIADRQAARDRQADYRRKQKERANKS